MNAVVSGRVYPDKCSGIPALAPEEILEQLGEYGVEVLVTGGRVVARNLRAAPLTLVEAFAHRHKEISAHLTHTLGIGHEGAAIADDEQSAASKPDLVIGDEITLAPALLDVIEADKGPRELAAEWARKLGQVHRRQGADDRMATLLDRARCFVTVGWHLQAARMGWNELEVFGVCPRAPWERLDRQGIAFSSYSLLALDRDVAVYAHRLRRQRVLVNNDGGAVPIWNLPELCCGNEKTANDKR